ATLDQATHAATLIRIEYEAQRPVVFGPQTAKDAVDPPQFLWPVASSVGDAEKAIAAAAVSIERTYTTSDRHHNQMEPHATTSVFDNYIEYAALCTRSLWGASGGIATRHKIAHVNRNTPTAMRSPHEALGHFALESGMDELAYASGVDPVALRLLTDTAIDPLSGRPFSTRAMRTCLTAGAARFGWDKRTRVPRSCWPRKPRATGRSSCRSPGEMRPSPVRFATTCS